MPDSPTRPSRIGVIGASTCSDELYHTAYAVGRHVARHGAILVCGGLGGVMEGASKGAFENGGLTVGILPGGDPTSANPYVALPIPTGLGHARNILVVQSSQVIVAIGGKQGTLSEIAIALKLGIPVIGHKTWNIDPAIILAGSLPELIDHLEKTLENP